MRHAIPLAALLFAACQSAPFEPHGDDGGGGTIGSGTLRATNALIGSGNRTDEDGSSLMGSGNDAQTDGDASPAMGGSSGYVGSDGTAEESRSVMGSGGRSEDDGGGTIGSGTEGASASSTLIGSGYRDGSGEDGAGSPMMGGGSG